MKSITSRVLPPGCSVFMVKPPVVLKCAAKIILVCVHFSAAVITAANLLTHRPVVFICRSFWTDQPQTKLSQHVLSHLNFHTWCFYEHTFMNLIKCWSGPPVSQRSVVWHWVCLEGRIFTHLHVFKGGNKYSWIFKLTLQYRHVPYFNVKMDLVWFHSYILLQVLWTSK